MGSNLRPENVPRTIQTPDLLPGAARRSRRRNHQRGPRRTRSLGVVWKMRRTKRKTAHNSDCGRNALMAVATRHLGWRRVEVIREIPGLGHGAAAQGIRRFWMQLPEDSTKVKFRDRLLSTMSHIKCDNLTPLPPVYRISSFSI